MDAPGPAPRVACRVLRIGTLHWDGAWLEEGIVLRLDRAGRWTLAVGRHGRFTDGRSGRFLRLVHIDYSGLSMRQDVLRSDPRVLQPAVR